MATARTRAVSKRAGSLLVGVLVLALLPVALAATAPRAAAAGPDGLIGLQVHPGYDQVNAPPFSGDIHTTDTIGAYKWLINKDISGDSTRDDANCLPASANDTLLPDGTANPHPLHPTAGSGSFPDGCKNPGVHSVSGAAPIVTSGDQSDLSSTTSLRLPNGKYLLSVTAPNFKIDGVHFTVNGEASPQLLNVTMNPMPVKTLTARVNVFNDNASTNGAWDGQLESFTAAGELNSEGDPVPVDINNMSGFVVHLHDVLGEVTTDVYGNALCTQYETNATGQTLLDGDGFPIVKPASDGGASGGQLNGSESLCVTGPDGQIAVPNLGPNRYAITVVPPDPQSVGGGKQWMQTTTLEGGQDWDSWNQEGGTGYDTERTVGGEATPMVDFGFVEIDTSQPNAANALPGFFTGTGTVHGNVSKGLTYTPTIGAPNYGFELGAGGTKIAGPIEDGLVSLNCLGECPNAGLDQAVWVGRADAAGNFAIPNVPQGTYVLTLWNEGLDWRMYPAQIEVKNGTVTELGTLPLLGWFTRITGHVFVDTNANGRRDPGERGVPEFEVTIRGRSNYLYDQAQVSSISNQDGAYNLDQVYPLTQWVVEEAYNQRYKTTGITFQADNQPAETTLVTSQVDIDLLPVIGLGGRIDWGVQPYAPGENGGIVGTVSYDSTRNETNGRKSGAEDYQPSVPDLPVQLWAPKRLPDGSVELTSTGAAKQYGVGGCARPEGDYGTDTIGSCQPLSTYTTETWARPKGCTTRDGDGNPIQMLSMPTNGDPNADCVEAPLSSVQVGGDGSVDGNYGFGTVFDAAGNEVPIPAGDYLVEVVSPLDSGVAALNGRSPRPIYKFSDETSINVFSGDTYRPQNGYAGTGGTPSGPTPHVQVNPAGDPLEDPADAAPAIDAKCAGANHLVDDSTNTDFVDAVGGSIFNTLQRHTCDVKLVRVVNGRSIAPTFFVYTDVPTATHFFGLVTNDLGVSTDKRSLMYGEVQEIGNMPIGMYDEAGRLKWKVTSDYNGFYEMILPSTDTYNCPLPAGPCPNVYRLVANDPGQPTAKNPEYNPAFRTIATEFQGWPGVLHPVDQAPTPIANVIEAPSSQLAHLPECAVSATRPQLFRVDDPILSNSHQNLVITGAGFGATRGSGNVALDGTPLSAGAYGSWSDTSITVNAFSSIAKGPHNLSITNTAGGTTVSGLTVHVTGSGYNPHVFRVRSDVPEGGTNFNPASDAFVDGAPAGGQRAIQRAVEAAHPFGANAIVVVNTNDDPRYAAFNPDHAFFENIVLHSPVKLQGIGPGGPGVPGSVINGSSFFTSPVGLIGPSGSFTQGDGAYSSDWQTFVDGLPRAGNPDSPNAEVIFVVAESQLQYAGTKASIDGLTITGGEQAGFPNNVKDVGGATNGFASEPQLTQGGGIFLNAYVPDYRISNNVIKSNGGTLGGGIRVGTPELGPEDVIAGAPPAAVALSNNNPRLKILNNRILANGGSNLAGGVGLFAGSDGYEVANNDICGNFSTEYGGGISHYGYSPGGKIHDNRIVLNAAYDEGGGIMVAGELPFIVTSLTDGAGPVDVYSNLIQANLSNDDGGGIRFLMGAGRSKSANDSGDYRFNVYNNIIANNVATHEGGGVAIDDTPNVRFVNNTVVRNLTTASAVTSNGLAAPAGLATSANSALLQQKLNQVYGASAPHFSNPVLFNDIFADNRAGTWTAVGVKGIGIGGASDVYQWDIGAADGAGPLSPTNSVFTSPLGTAGPGNRVLSSIDQLVFKQLYDVTVDVSPLRTNPQFRQALIVAVEAPVGDMGDYRLGLPRPVDEPAVDKGAASKTVVNYGTTNAPITDIDLQLRPAGGAFDIGASEIPGPTADLAVTKSDGRANVMPGDVVTYTIPVKNNGPSAANGAAVTDTVPARLSNVTWTCSATGGSSCAAASGAGSINTTVNLANGGTATFTLNGTVTAGPSGTLTNTATVTAPPGVGDPAPGNNSATDTDRIVPAAPSSSVLDNFNRTANNLNTGAPSGVAWSQPTAQNGNANIRPNGTQANANQAGRAVWNGPNNSFGANQAAGFTFGNLVSNTCLLMKATLGTPTAPQRYLRLCYQTTNGGRIVVSTTVNAGGSFQVRGTLDGAFANGDALSAIAAPDGTVYVYKTAGGTTTVVGTVAIPTSSWAPGASGGQVGIQLPQGARIDDFKGGTLP